MDDNKIEHCSFCGNHKEDVVKLIVSEGSAICSECVDLCNKLIREDSTITAAANSKEGLVNYDAREIKEYLDSYVIGQDQAKTVLAVAISNHYKRISSPPAELELQKGNVLFVGPTGSGKTLLVKTISKYVDVPFVIANATSLTEAGYVGEDVENMLSMLLNHANNDIALAERGIIFIDEVDKIARKSENSAAARDVSGEGVQQALLKIIEGTVCRVNVSGKRKPNSEVVEINTKNILFIAGGSFVGIDKIVNNRTKSISIGFGATPTINDSPPTALLPDDLVNFGMIPEFIGRFSTTITLDNLTEDELIAVLTSIKNSFIDQYKYIFSLDGVKLVFTDNAVRQLAKNCIKLKTGARGLHAELERVLMPAMFNIKYLKSKSISVDKHHVDDPHLILKENEVFEPKKFKNK